MISRYSAHADRDELLDWFKQIRARTPQPEHVFVVHGQEEASDVLAEAFTDLGILRVCVPELAQMVEVKVSIWTDKDFSRCSLVRVGQ